MLNGMFPADIQMPIAGRTQIHPFGHILFPKFHRLPDHQVIQPQLLHVGGKANAKRASANDQYFGFFSHCRCGGLHVQVFLFRNVLF